MSTPHTCRYLGDCVSLGLLDLDELRHMIDSARPITRRTFVRRTNTDDRRQWEQNKGYAYHGRATLLTAARDLGIGYYRSTWAGRPCVYLTWSAYEVVFVENTERR